MARVYDSDVRYGSSFLSIHNKSKAESGEILSDKVTGEIYIKRPADDKIISFNIKSQTTYQAVAEFNMQYRVAALEEFEYPKDAKSYLLGMRIPVDEYEGPNTRDLLFENYPFDAGLNNPNFGMFKVSHVTNGFFIKANPRTNDRMATGYLAGRFADNETTNFLGSTKTFQAWLASSSLYGNAALYDTWKALDKWIGSSAMVDYHAVANGLRIVNGVTTGTAVTDSWSGTTPIRLGEYSYVGFNRGWRETFYPTEITVYIDKIYAPKLQYERDLFGGSSTITDGGLNKLIEVDRKIVLKEVDFFYFISDPNDLPSSKNMEITQCIDADFLDQALDEIANAATAKSWQSTEQRPYVWPMESIWAEELRDVKPGQFFNWQDETNSETKFGELESSLYNNGDGDVVLTQYSSDSVNEYLSIVRRVN